MTVLLALLLIAPPAVAQEGTSPTWELRVCAHPDNYPASSQQRPGYENRIAAILADELGARLTIEWTMFDDHSISRTLHAGSCDAIIGIGESVGGVESTVPFLRAPYVFVTRAADDLDLDSLDDPRLSELTIGTYPAGIPSLALRNRGLSANVREFSPLATVSTLDRDTPILDALISGEVDVAIVFAPIAAARAEAEPGLLQLEPVTPETDFGATLLQMFRTFTIGVRPHDTSLRDTLNHALAARWSEIQEAIDRYGVHRLQVQQPLGSGTPRAVPRIGVVVPAHTGDYHPLEAVGEAARQGVELARNYIARSPQDVPFEILLANAPTDASAVRAAERLAATGDVIAIVGGFGNEQAALLAKVAEKWRTVFYNIGASSDALRGEACSSATFHIEASASMYADAAIRWYDEADSREFYLVHEATDAGEELLAHVKSGLQERLVGSSAVRRGQFVYTDEIRAITEVSPDVLLLQLDYDDLILFYGQLRGRGLESAVTVIPDLRGQTREHLFRLSETAPKLVSGVRPALWEGSIDEGEAGTVNRGFISRAGHPMEPAAWTAYAAALITYEAAAADSAESAEQLKAFLAEERSLGLTLGKGPLSFRPWDNQLSQPFFMVSVNPNAAWGRELAPRLAVAEQVGVIPRLLGSDQLEHHRELQELGRGPESSDCRF